MKKIYFACILFAFCLPAKAQTVYPGGVGDISVWNVAEQDASGHYGWVDMLAGKLSIPATTGTKLNAHASAWFDGDKNAFVVPLKKDRTKAFTVFIVYQPTQSNGEQSVWTVNNEAGTSLVMTTRRLGDLEQYRVINYAVESEPQYRIFTYTRNEPAESGEDNEENLLFNIGQQPADKTIPVKNFKGYIPEIILYNRVLSWNERQRVESYLAVKYGISLSQTFPASYLDSGGKVVWDATRENRFNRNITAIGRDDRSGLLQTSSTSSREPGLLQVSLGRKEELSDKHFLVWADNGGDLRFKQQEGKWKPCDRVWKMWETGNLLDQDLTLEFDLSRFPRYFTSIAQRYALLIDHSGSGDFPEKEISIAEATPEGNVLRFSGINRRGTGVSQAFALAVDTVPEAQRKAGSNFAYLVLYPNPTVEGNFRLDIGLHREAHVDLKLFDSAGSLISSEELRGSSYYLYKGYLPQTGVYIVQVTSNGSSENLKPIRN